MKYKILCTALVCALGMSSNAFAASACKGLSKTQCEGKNECSWVGSYERKDGAVVNAFCRKAAGGKTKAKAKAAAVEKDASKTTKATKAKADKKTSKSKAKKAEKKAKKAKAE